MMALDDPRGFSRKEVVSVTLLQERMRTEITRVPAATRHVFEWVLGVVGVLAAAVGAYLFYAPANWVLAGLAEAWYFGMFVGADILLAAAFGVLARRVYLADRTWTTQVVLGTGLMVLELAGAVTCAVIWIL
jgi:predicted outer membrane lipoprotein